MYTTADQPRNAYRKSERRCTLVLAVDRRRPPPHTHIHIHTAPSPFQVPLPCCATQFRVVLRGTVFQLVSVGAVNVGFSPQLG